MSMSRALKNDTVRDLPINDPIGMQVEQTRCDFGSVEAELCTGSFSNIINRSCASIRDDLYIRLHSHRFLETTVLLDAIHQVTTVGVLHYEV